VWRNVRSAGTETRRLAREGRITSVLRSYEGAESIFVPATSQPPFPQNCETVASHRRDDATYRSLALRQYRRTLWKEIT
jgi:hypothetical protein